MNQEQLEAKSLGDLREIAKLQGVKSITKYRKPELVRIIMNGGVVPQNEVANEVAEPANAAAEPTVQKETSEPVGEAVPSPAQRAGSAPVTVHDLSAPRMRASYTPRPPKLSKAIL